MAQRLWVDVCMCVLVQLALTLFSEMSRILKSPSPLADQSHR